MYGHTLWSNVRNFFKETLGLPFLTEKHGTKGNPNAKIDTAVSNMKSIFEFQWRNELSHTTSRNKTGGNKLRTYYTFKKKFEYEKYVDLQGNFALRRNISKIRTSSHKLEIEAGRYSNSSNKIKPNKKRDCKNCDLGEIEDEAHAIMCCPKYEAERKNILDTLTEAFPCLEHWNSQEIFIFMMQCHDWEGTMHYRRFSQPYKKKEGVYKLKEHEERSKVNTLQLLPQSILR